MEEDDDDDLEGLSDLPVMRTLLMNLGTTKTQEHSTRENIQHSSQGYHN